MPAIWNPPWSLSNHPTEGTVPRGTNAPAHLGAPLATTYLSESANTQVSKESTTSDAAKTTTRPPGTSSGNAASIHSDGTNVALDDATENACPGSSSCRQRSTSNRAHRATVLLAAARNAQRFARGSTSKVRQSGLKTANGTPGRPPPAPTSTTLAPFGANRAKANESGRWSPTNSSTPRAPVKLTRAFHCNSNSKNAAIASAWKGVTDQLHALA